jgi:hypothetical protein
MTLVADEPFEEVGLGRIFARLRAVDGCPNLCSRGTGILVDDADHGKVSLVVLLDPVDEESDLRAALEQFEAIQADLAKAGRRSRRRELPLVPQHPRAGRRTTR